MGNKIRQRSFTVQMKGIAKELRIKVKIASVIKTHKVINSECDAIWDTGATRTIVSHRIANNCRLKEVGFMNVVGISGKPKIIPTYYVNIYLPGRIIFSNQLVGAHTLSMDYDVLIGMDIVSQSDFSLGYNAQNKGTVFSVTFLSNGVFQLLDKNK